MCHIGFTDSKGVRSHLTTDENFVIIFHKRTGYNVYDICKDCWLFKKSETIITHNDFDVATQSMLIDDKIIILSHFQTIDVYFLKNLQTLPILIRSYKIGSYNYYFGFHGMCCIDIQKIFNNNAYDHDASLTLTGLIDDKDEKKIYESDIDIVDCNFKQDEKDCTYGCTLKLITFGGIRNGKFLRTFVCFHITIMVDFQSLNILSWVNDEKNNENAIESTSSHGMKFQREIQQRKVQGFL